MITVFVLFLVLLFLGVPVAFAIFLSGITFFLQHPEFPLTQPVQLPLSQLQNITLMALPLFIFAGNLMNASGITKRLVKLALVLTGHMRGGLAQVNVVLATLMGGVSGSANADAAMQARVLGPDMIKSGYSKGFAGAVISYSGLITATIPPAISMILYGTTGNVSIGRLFAGGLIAGLILMVLYMLLVGFMAHRYGLKPARAQRASTKEIVSVIFECIWAVIFPILLLVGIRLGFYTPSEVGAFACVYALFVGKFIYRELDFIALMKALKTSVIDIGAIMLMISMSGVFGYGIPIERLPQKLTEFATSLTDSPQVIVFIIIAFLVIAGMFMEGAVTILLTTPILLPLILSYGIDPVVFGIMMCIIVTMGNMTPPVGMAMYIVCGILKIRLEEFMKNSWPFIVLILTEMVIFTFYPETILWFVNLMYE